MNAGIEKSEEKKKSSNTPRDNFSFINNTQNGSARTKSNLIEIPSISLPKGGGAIKSIDEKFSVNASNGTSSYSIPLPFSQGRNGQSPALSLSYNSGGGASLFGIGWNVDFPSIHRRTDKKLPEYNDAEESDVFLFSGIEDLVPELIKDNKNNWVKNHISFNGIFITHYRPRIEGSFIRIERINDNGNIYWRTRTKDNTVSVFGKSDECKLYDPLNKHKIFKWCIEFSYDDKGNLTRYYYKQENKDSITPSIYEKNRLNDLALYTNIYLKRIKYGNVKAFYEGDSIPDDFLFELVFDFGEHDKDKPTTKEGTVWTERKDAFSDFKAGFEIRTHRLCRRILMFHHFKNELGWDDYLVRSSEFLYDENPHITYLENIVQSGYIWNSDGTLKSKKSFPPLEFSYIKPGFSTEVKEVSESNSTNVPVGLDNQLYQWTDLYSEGVSGILTEQVTGWFYKENMGEGNFLPARLISPRPSFTGLSGGGLVLQDLEADGKKYMVTTDSSVKGFFPFNETDQWQPFQTFEKYPNINLKDPNLKFLDLNGDGMPDMLISHEQEFIWYAAAGKSGYDDYHLIGKAADDEKGPQILFSDSDQRMLIATIDMNGDGLSDIVVVTYANVSYYPNLGYGKFGARVTMQMNDCFDTITEFNPKHIHFADIDGSGTTDIIYTGKNKVQVWFNQSGNSLSQLSEIFNPFPELSDYSKLSFVDFLGNGTSCMVWSSSLPHHSHSPLRYIDLMNGQKPHVMYKHKNNLGKEVTLEYKSSTYYYLEDKKQGKPWVTRLPFSVQCVSKVIAEDKVAQTRFASEYSYHHGYYDAREREFRGFAMVEQRDAESYETYIKETQSGGAKNSVEKDLLQPVVITKSWFHTGAYLNREELFHQLQQEYYKDVLAADTHLLDESPLPEELSAEEISECYRSLKGLPLRKEIYSEEGEDNLKIHPYTITQHNYEVKRIQPRSDNKYAVFLSHEKETLTFNLERNPSDPRIAHTINIEIDSFGNVLQSASIVYGRNKPDAQLPTEKDKGKQTQQHVTYIQNSFTKAIDSEQVYRLPVGYETQTWELNTAIPSSFFFTLDEIIQRFTVASVKLYEQETTLNEKRKIEHSRILFLKNDLTGPMPLGTIDTLALPYENYLLAFTPSLIQNIFGAKADENFLRNKARYVKSEGDDNYWIKSGRIYFHPDISSDPSVKTIPVPGMADITFAKNNFYMPVAYEDNFGILTKKILYDKYCYSIEHTIDALNNEFKVLGFNYRSLLPYLLQDSNDNRSGVRYDEFGMVTHTFLMGKENEYKGDLLDTLSVELSVNDQPSSVLEYDFRYYESNGQWPDRVKTSVREKHYYKEAQPDEPPQGVLGWLSNLFGGNGNPNNTPLIETNSKWQISYTYSDGSGHEVLKKIQAEPGLGPERDAMGNLMYDAFGRLKQSDTGTELRWVGNGRIIYNNKGKPVKQYEPYFDSSPEYNMEAELSELGFTSILYYDALGRMIRTEHPNGTFSKILFDSWKQIVYDENDTVLDSQWYKDRINGAKGEAEQEAVKRTVIHDSTPTITYLDSLGRPFLSVAQNKTLRNSETVQEEFYYTRTELDIEGNARSIVDARGNTVMSWKYDMLGNICFQRSMDAGDRWILWDVTRKPVRLWNNRQQIVKYEYDELHRPLSLNINTGAGDSTFEKYEYGENVADDKLKNLRTKLYRHYDTAGLILNEAYDFKGNSLVVTRRLASDYKNAPDWKTNPVMENKEYTTETSYDALNRPVQMISPDDSIFFPQYNEAGLLNSMDVKIKGASVTTNFISDINYNAKGQREAVFYGNNTKTSYAYEPDTYRLTRLLTTGNNGQNILQDLNFTYDPAGNITRQFDNAQKTVFYGGQQVEAQSDYIYDALYRLVEANGREHSGQVTFNAQDNYNDDWCRLALQPNSPMQLRNYSQKYFYDSAGNILKMQHITGGMAGNWTRVYNYNPANNQLIKTTVGGQSYNYTYNEHGSIQTMPQLQQIDWNFREEMQHVSLGGGGDAWYVYDGSGQRTRKVIERQGNKIEERIYLGAFEIYRERTSNTITLERETLHVMDDHQRIAMVETRTIGNDGSDKQLIRYQYSNHLGTACLELDGFAKIISYEEYHPYGTTAYQATDAARQVPKKRYRYTGMERDEETGLNYHSARYYMNWLGRWLSTDPSGIYDGHNGYMYVKANPVKQIDSNGRVTTPPPGLLGGHPTLATLWDQAAQKVLSRRFDGATIQENYKLFSEHIQKLGETAGMGSNRAKGTARNVAREIYSSVRSEFGHLAEAAGDSVKGMQMHHAVDTVHANPGQALNPWNLTLTTGNAASKGSMHNKAHLALEKAKAGIEKLTQKMKDITKETSVVSKGEELTTVAKTEGAAAKLVKGAGAAKKILGPLGAGLGVFFLKTKIANAAAKSAAPEATDAATRMEQTFDKYKDYAEIGAEGVALLPGSPGKIAAVALVQKDIAIAGIQATGGDQRIVDAGKSAEAFAKRHGWSDVNAETAGAVTAGAAGILEGARVIAEVSSGPIGWASLAYRVWKKK